MIHRRRKRIRPTNGLAQNRARDECFNCRRPKRYCYCDLIPAINNQTEVIIAQHIRERSHPFNTARIVSKSLTNSKLIVDYAENFHSHSQILNSETGILFPGADAIELESLAHDQRPKRLLLLDGTWNQAKRMYRKWPAAQSLRHFKLCPKQPGQYRIRLEPDDISLSTIEATVMALRILEPQTKCLDELLGVFETMVDRQLAHPNAKYEAGIVPRKPTLNIPRSLLTQGKNLVIAYGEAEPIERGSPRKFFRLPALWVAQRPATNETFKCSIQTNSPVKQELLDYFKLHQSDFTDAVSIDEFESRWRSFLNPNDILVVYNAGALRLLRAAGAHVDDNAISLQSVNYDPEREYKTLRDFLIANQQGIPTPIFPGRSGERLANLAALVAYLQSQLQAMIDAEI